MSCVTSVNWIARKNPVGPIFELTEMEVQACPVKRMSPVCLMTRDGFTFLAMGFTGQ